MTILPTEAQTALTRYLRQVDAALPGRVEGLYLVGSVALGDYQPERSDLDFVALTRTRLSAAERDSLARAHRALAREIHRPHVDGLYLIWEDLARDPRSLRDVPFAHEGRLLPDGRSEANPPIWLTLRRHALTVRGPATLNVWCEGAAVGAWCLDNLRTYWTRQLEWRSSLRWRATCLASPRALHETIAWCVPGVARLHYTIATGDITSKSGACRYAQEAFPARWHPIIEDALALRAGKGLSPRSRLERLDNALELMAAVIQDAESLRAPGASSRS